MAGVADKRVGLLEKKVKKLEKRLSLAEEAITYLYPEWGEEKEESSPAIESTPIQETASVLSAPAKKTKSKKPSKPIENLGFKIFGAIGFLLIILGIWYFYQYAVDQEWINHFVRVFLGLLFGIIVLFASEVARKKHYDKYSEMLTGGGIAILYFVSYITYYFQDYREALGMTLSMNTTLLFIVILFAIWFSLRQNSLLLTVFAFFLGYVSSWLSAGTHQTLLSALLLSAGLIYLIGKKGWNIAVYPLAASYLLFFIFIANRRVDESNQVVTLLYLIAFFLLFVIMSFSLRKVKDDMIPVVIPLGNALAVLALGRLFFSRMWPDSFGLFVFGMAAVYGVARYVTIKYDDRAADVFSLIGLSLLTLALLIELDRQWVTMAWIAQATILIWFGCKKDGHKYRVLGYVITGLSLYRYYEIDFVSGFPDRTLTLITLLLGIGISLYALRQMSSIKKEKWVVNLLGIVGLLVVTQGLAVEILDKVGLFANLTNDGRVFTLTIAWLVEAAVFVWIGVKRQASSLRLVGYLLSILVLGKVLFFDSWSLDFGLRTASFALAIGGTYLVSLMKTTKKEEESVPMLFGIVATLLLVVGLLVEVLDSSGVLGGISADGRFFFLTLAWIIVSSVLLYRGLSGHTWQLNVGCGVLVLSVIKVLFYDVGKLEYGLRTASFLMTFAVLYGFTRQVRGKSGTSLASVFGLGTALVALVALAIEISDPNGLFSLLSDNARNVTFSVAWAVESLVLITLGFVQKEKLYRNVGVIIFSVTVAKILLFDLGNLETIYRTLVTVIVGIIALGASFSYVKNKDKIKKYLNS